MGMYYTTTGSVRDACGHKHRTLRGAADCLREDQCGCRKQGGYSDRRVVACKKHGDDYEIHELNDYDYLVLLDMIDNP